MSQPEPNSENPPPPKGLPPIRLAPSRNQKQRSKLRQVADETNVEEPTPTPPPAPVTKPAPEPTRRVRLKRSGQMHADLTGPMPPDESRDETEY